MIESFPVETRDLGVDSGMLDVARNAGAAGITVHSLPGGDALGDRRVTGEAFRGGDLLSGLVALLAVVETLEAGVRSRERSGGDETADLLRGEGAREGEDRQPGQEKNAVSFPVPHQGAFPAPHHGTIA
jgi:hypothetical protein